MPKKNELAIKAATAAGGPTALAHRLGVKPPTVHQWMKGERPIPSARCRAIEEATGGAVTAAELRPDVFGDSAA